MIKCKICSKEFKFNYLLTRHYSSKKKCKSVIDEIDKINEINEINDINKINEIDKINDKDEFLPQKKRIAFCSDNDDDDDDKDDDDDDDDDNKDNDKDDDDNKDDIINRKIFNNKKYSKINKLEKEIQIIDDRILNDSAKSIHELKCMFCMKDFSKKYNITRHINNYCSTIKKLNENKLKLNEQKNKLNEEMINLRTQIELQELRKAVKKILKRKPQNINITNNKITNNKITNNNLMVNINSFGNESLSHITVNDYKRFLSGLFPGFIRFIEKVHFDENAPENHNICITNMNSKYLFTYDMGNWLSKDKNDTIDKFIAKKYNILVEKFDELEEKNELDAKISERFNIFSRNYQDIDAQKITKNDIMLMIYNNKNKVNMK